MPMERPTEDELRLYLYPLARRYGVEEVHEPNQVAVLFGKHVGGGA
jgi:hypothetical protein